MAESSKTTVTAVFDPDSDSLPLRANLPLIPGAPKEAAWFWGPDDNLGRLNLLTPRRTLAAASEIKLGESVTLDLPLNVPEEPAFGRQRFEHTIKRLDDGVWDDIYHLNTQSGSQWDGFRHFCDRGSRKFYNNANDNDIVGPNANDRGGVGHWAQKGIVARGVLLDYRAYAKAKGVDYDPFEYHAISYQNLVDCGKSQGIDIRPASQGGDIKVGDALLVRSGFVERYHELPKSKRAEAAHRTHVVGEGDKQAWAGLLQEEAMLDWVHDSYFSAVAGDAPSWEAWPSKQDYIMHEYVLTRWGIPIGEMWDLERLAAKCHKLGRWTFFLTSAPAHLPRGIASHPNAIAIF